MGSTELCLMLFLVHASDSQNYKFTVRWGNPSNAYYPLPWSVEEAGLGTLWRRAGYDHELNVLLVSHIEDPRFFLLFDKQNTIAGVTFGYDKRDVNRVMQQDSNHNYTFPDTMFHSANIWDKDLWLNPVLFADPETIRTTGRPKLNSGANVISELHYWVDFGWRLAPLSESDVTTELVQQGCYKGMGKHYFYKTSSDTECAQWQGFFVTYDHGRLAGFGVAVFGSFVSTYFTTTYYEYPDFSVVKSILPNRPACVAEWLPFTGVTSVHVFVKADAANISCDQESLKPTDDVIMVVQPSDQSNWPTWIHVPTFGSPARLDTEPSLLITAALSAAIILHYFTFY